MRQELEDAPQPGPAQSSRCRSGSKTGSPAACRTLLTACRIVSHRLQDARRKSEGVLVQADLVRLQTHARLRAEDIAERYSRLGEEVGAWLGEGVYARLGKEIDQAVELVRDGFGQDFRDPR